MEHNYRYYFVDATEVQMFVKMVVIIRILPKQVRSDYSMSIAVLTIMQYDRGELIGFYRFL